MWAQLKGEVTERSYRCVYPCHNLYLQTRDTYNCVHIGMQPLINTWAPRSLNLIVTLYEDLLPSIDISLKPRLHSVQFLSSHFLKTAIRRLGVSADEITLSGQTLYFAQREWGWWYTCPSLAPALLLSTGSAWETICLVRSINSWTCGEHKRYSTLAP